MIRKFILTIFLSIFAFKGCNGGSERIYQGDDGVMKYEMDGKYHRYSLDSLIEADTLPMIEYWIQSPFKDYETKERIVRMIFMKDDIVYIVESV